ncbi:hypothetical protein LWS69_02005 [Bordetella hinzii]|nr:hypothetical protein [Bordetella hinzii]HCF2496494.1 hypothetical protein [Pseudomonas aeruginosa]HCF2903125.1 hypothetical protein [Pseudomonas aeruginosa]
MDIHPLINKAEQGAINSLNTVRQLPHPNRHPPLRQESERAEEGGPMIQCKEKGSATQWRIKQLKDELKRLSKFGTWEDWTRKDTRYLLGQMKTRMVEDCQVPSPEELVYLAIDVYQKEYGGGRTNDEVIQDLLKFARTVHFMTGRGTVTSEVMALLNNYLVSRGFPSDFYD